MSIRHQTATWKDPLRNNTASTSAMGNAKAASNDIPPLAAAMPRNSTTNKDGRRK